MSATEQDVELAILSLDAYNRGYLPGMPLSLSQAAVPVGGATLQNTSTTALGVDANGVPIDQSASFYAVSYDWNGKTVIAYRGTRFDGANYTLPDAGDVLNGWTLSAGFAQASQAQLAMQFYTDVTGAQVALGQAPGSVILTGHSLGGGLAGFVADLTGLPADVFNNIPFGASVAGEALFAGGSLIGLPTSSVNVRQFDIANEIAGYLRATGDAASVPLFLAELMPTWGLLEAPIAAGAAAEDGFQLDQSTTSETLNSNAGAAASASCLHSMGLNALLTYADWKQYSGWQTIGAQLYNAEFSDSLAEQIGIPDSSPESGWYAASGKMIAAIAYSAAQGTSPFGQRAAASYFADADLLGNLVSSASPSSILSLPGVQQDLADILVQFAGDQAWTAGQNGGVDCGSLGIGDFSDSDGALTVDLAPAEWTSTTQNGGQIVGAARLVNDVINPLLAPIWANVVPPSEFSTAIDSIANALTEIVIGTNARVAINVSNTPDAIVAAADGDSVTGGSCNALILGGAFVDTGCGDDVVVAQTDDETITLGSGADFVVGNYDPSGQLGDTVVLSGPRSAYEITSDAVGGNTVDIAGASAGSATDYVVANVGQFQFADQTLSYSDLLAIKDVQFSSGGSEAAAAAPSSTPTLIGSIAGQVGNRDDTLTYTLDPNDPSSQDFTLTPDGVLSLNAGVQVNEGTWLSSIGALLNAGWNWVAGALGEMVSNGSAEAAEASPQQLLAGTPFEVTVDVADSTTGATTEQTLVIPDVGRTPLSLTFTPKESPLTQATDDTLGVELGTLSATGDLASMAKLSVDPSQQGLFSIKRQADGSAQLWLQPGVDLSQATGLVADVIATTPFGSTTQSFSVPVAEPYPAIVADLSKAAHSLNAQPGVGQSIGEIDLSGGDADSNAATLSGALANYVTLQKTAPDTFSEIVTQALPFPSFGDTSLSGNLIVDDGDPISTETQALNLLLIAPLTAVSITPTGAQAQFGQSAPTMVGKIQVQGGDNATSLSLTGPSAANFAIAPDQNGNPALWVVANPQYQGGTTASVVVNATNGGVTRQASFSTQVLIPPVTGVTLAPTGLVANYGQSAAVMVAEIAVHGGGGLASLSLSGSDAQDFQIAPDQSGNPALWVVANPHCNGTTTANVQITASAGGASASTSYASILDSNSPVTANLSSAGLNIYYKAPVGYVPGDIILSGGNAATNTVSVTGVLASYISLTEIAPDVFQETVIKQLPGTLGSLSGMLTLSDGWVSSPSKAISFSAQQGNAALALTTSRDARPLTFYGDTISPGVWVNQLSATYARTDDIISWSLSGAAAADFSLTDVVPGNSKSVNLNLNPGVALDPNMTYWVNVTMSDSADPGELLSNSFKVATVGPPSIYANGYNGDWNSVNVGYIEGQDNVPGTGTSPYGTWSYALDQQSVAEGFALEPAMGSASAYEDMIVAPNGINAALGEILSLGLTATSSFGFCEHLTYNVSDIAIPGDPPVHTLAQTSCTILS